MNKAELHRVKKAIFSAVINDRRSNIRSRVRRIMLEDSIRESVRKQLNGNFAQVSDSTINEGIGDFFKGIFKAFLALFGVNVENSANQTYSSSSTSYRDSATSAIDSGKISMDDLDITDKKSSEITDDDLDPNKATTAKGKSKRAALRDALIKIQVKKVMKGTSDELKVLEDVPAFFDDAKNENRFTLNGFLLTEAAAQELSKEEMYKKYEPQVKKASFALGKLVGISRFIRDKNPDFQFSELDNAATAGDLVQQAAHLADKIESFVTDASDEPEKILSFSDAYAQKNGFQLKIQDSGYMPSKNIGGDKGEALTAARAEDSKDPGDIFSYTTNKGKEIFVKVSEDQDNVKEGLVKVIRLNKAGDGWTNQAFSTSKNKLVKKVEESEAFGGTVSSEEALEAVENVNDEIERIIPSEVNVEEVEFNEDTAPSEEKSESALAQLKKGAEEAAERLKDTSGMSDALEAAATAAGAESLEDLIKNNSAKLDREANQLEPILEDLKGGEGSIAERILRALPLLGKTIMTGSFLASIYTYLAGSSVVGGGVSVLGYTTSGVNVGGGVGAFLSAHAPGGIGVWQSGTLLGLNAAAWLSIGKFLLIMFVVSWILKWLVKKAVEWEWTTENDIEAFKKSAIDFIVGLPKMVWTKVLVPFFFDPLKKLFSKAVGWVKAFFQGREVSIDESMEYGRIILVHKTKDRVILEYFKMMTAVRTAGQVLQTFDYVMLE